MNASAYFLSLLTGGLQEAAQAEVRVELKAALLRPVLRFLYCGDGGAAGVDAANATELLGVAGMLQASGDDAPWATTTAVTPTTPYRVAFAVSRCPNWRASARAWSLRT